MQVSIEKFEILAIWNVNHGMLNVAQRYTLVESTFNKN